MANQWSCVIQQRVMRRPRNRPQPLKRGDAIPAGLNDGMAPKVRTTLALYRLGVSNASNKLPQLALTQKFTKGQELVLRWK